MDIIFKVLIDAVRGIMFFIDSIVYGLIPSIYKLIVSLANVDLYSNNPAINALLKRIYIIIGIFMLFKLAFSVLRYIVDPNSFSDSAKGFTGLVRRVVIAIILLVSIPFLFEKLYSFQEVILNNGILSNLILGTETYDANDMNEAAIDLQFTMFSPFFSLNTGTENVTNELSSCAPDSDDRPLSNIIGTADMALKENCLEDFANAMNTDPSVRASKSTLDKFFKQDGVDNREFSALGGLLTWTLSDGDYAINYTPVISTICGGYLVFLLLSFCVDIAVRAIKLLFLQILSPVAIISSIDPTTSSQNDKLKEWGMECLKTYISLFLRLIVIYTVIQMMFIITSKVFAPESLYFDGFEPDATLNIWVYIFLILGAFSVAKKIPELIEKAFGIKMSGEINMSPFKNFTNNPAFMALSGAAVGGFAGSLAGGVSAYTTAKNLDRGLGSSLLSAAGGVASGGLTGSFRGFKAKGLKGFDAGSQSGGRIARRMEVRAATGGLKGVPGMAIDRVRDKVGAPTTYESLEAKAKRYDDVVSSADSVKEYITGELKLKNSDYKQIQARKTRYEQLLREGGKITEASMIEAVKPHYDNKVLNAATKWNDLSKQFKSSYYQSMNPASQEYIDMQNKVNNAERDFIAARNDYDLLNNGQMVMNDELYVTLQNQAYQEEQQMVADFYNDARQVDAAGNVTYKDDNLKFRMQSLEKTINDSHDENLKNISLDSWRDIAGDGNKDSIKAKANSSALDVRSDPGYNDAHDRHDAIHGARRDAHFKH